MALTKQSALEAANNLATLATQLESAAADFLVAALNTESSPDSPDATQVLALKEQLVVVCADVVKVKTGFAALSAGINQLPEPSTQS